MNPEVLMGAILALVLGAAVGSFLNVVIYRLPARESVVHPRSRCMQCGNTITWYDNIPILSYLLLCGRCRACGTGFSARYPIVEVLAAMVSFSLWAQLDFSIAYFGYFAFACALLAIAYIDLDHQIIPNEISLPGIVIGVLFRLAIGIDQPVAALTDSLLGILLGGGLLLAVAWGYERMTGREGMGGGDVKLLAMIGAFLGWRGVLLTLLMASFLGSAVGIVIMVAQRADRKLAIPFGPFLALGALIGLFWGEAIVRWYISYAGWSQL